MANPRKFSEKIALQKQKQAEGTAEFERIMKEVYATKMEDTQTNQKNFDCCLGVVTAAGGSPDESIGGGAGGNNSPASYRESRVRSPGVGPMRRPSERKQDRSPYGNNLTNAGPIALSNSGQNTAYLSPPMDISWRRSNSDSALHQSLTNAVAADGNFAGANLTDSPENLGTMHTNYQLHDQRSLSPQICKSFSPQAQRRKGSMIPEPNLNQQQLQVHHYQQELQYHQLQQQQAHSLQLSLHQQHFNAKFFNCNMPVNNIFKTLHEQTMAIGNTGSLPDLTSKRFTAPTQQLIQQQEQQLTASPALSPHSNHNSCSDRDQSPSPFSPGNGGLPSSPYNQQQHSPTPATTPAAQTSPHLSFTNLTVQSPRSPQQSPRSSAAPYVHIHNMGAANSTGNLTDYRQPQNPPSPGSSPGLLTSVASNDLHASEPSSPIRHQQKQTMMQQQQGYNTKAIQRACERYSDSSYNTLNHSFHNHFEHFSLGDNTSLPDQQQHFQQQPNLYTSLEFDSFDATTDGNCIGVVNGQQQAYSPSLEANKLLDFNSLNVLPGRRTSPTLNINNEIRINTTAPTNRACRSNNNQQHQQLIGRTHATSPHQHQPLLNNNSTSINNPSTTNCPTNNNTSNFDTQHSNASAVVPPLSLSPLPSISTSLPIPISTQHQQPQQQTVSTPHHASPVSVASPVLSSLGCAISSRPELSANTTLASVSHHPQNPSNKTQTSANIPSIIFSDYSSHSDFSREIFDTLDLDLGQMDVTGLQILSDPSTIMITDPTIEDSFRRDLN